MLPFYTISCASARASRESTSPNNDVAQVFNYLNLGILYTSCTLSSHFSISSSKFGQFFRWWTTNKFPSA
eukprot:2310214-Amphidinium_carterae.2